MLPDIWCQIRHGYCRRIFKEKQSFLTLEFLLACHMIENGKLRERERERKFNPQTGGTNVLELERAGISFTMYFFHKKKLSNACHIPPHLSNRLLEKFFFKFTTTFKKSLKH